MTTHIRIMLTDRKLGLQALDITFYQKGLEDIKKIAKELKEGNFTVQIIQEQETEISI